MTTDNKPSRPDLPRRPDKMHNGLSSGNLMQQRQETQSELLPAARAAAPHVSQAIMRLCSAKNRAQMTRFDVETWCAVLSVYPASVANFAILEIALNSDPFPDLGKVVARCQAKMAETAKVPSQADPTKLSRGRLLEIAKALQIQIEERGHE